MADGSRHFLAGIKEKVYGQTPQTGELFAVRNSGTGLAITKDSLESDEIRDDRQIADFRLGLGRYTGDHNFEFSFDSFDQLLEGVFFNTWQTYGEAESTNKILTTGSERISYSFLRRFGDMGIDEGASNANTHWRYAGVELSQLKMTVKANAMVKGSFTCTGRCAAGQHSIGHDMASAGFGNCSVGKPTTTRPMDTFTGSMQQDGKIICAISEITFTLDNKLEDKDTVGNCGLRSSAGRSNVTGNVQAFFENTMLYKKFLDEEDTMLMINFPDDKGNEYTLVIPRVKYTGAAPDVTGEGAISLPLPFQALMYTAPSGEVDPIKVACDGKNIALIKKPAAV